MNDLLIKVFFAGLGLTVLFFILKKGIDLLGPVLQISSRLNQLQYFIKNNIYDEPTVLRAAKFYVPLKCQNLSPDKRTAVKKDLTQTLLQFYHHKTQFRLVFILAEPGMGKTCFALNFHTLIQKLPSKKTHPLILIPLNSKNADQMIMAVPDKSNTTLFLDGLDEDTRAFLHPSERIIQLIETTKNFKKVIITGTVNFMPDYKYRSIQKGYEIILNQQTGENSLYKFQILYIPQMTYSRAQKILNRMLPVWKSNIKASILKYIYSNSDGVIPLTLGYLPDILPEQPTLLSKTYLFENIIKNWVHQQHLWPNKAELNCFLKKIAADMFLNRLIREEEIICADELKTRLDEWKISVYPFRETAFSLIYKCPQGSIRFTHRLFMEYLFIRQLLSADKHCYQIPLTEGMKDFLFEDFNSRQSLNLKNEFEWLKPFNIKTHGLKLKSDENEPDNRPALFATILNKNSQYDFLKQLSRLLENSIFIHFGWDARLFKNLKQAVYESKSSFMELKKKRWNVLINYQQIEVTQKGQPTWRIILDENIYNEYASLLDNVQLIKLSKTIGLDGLKNMNAINQSKHFALLPHLKTLNSFTLFFWEPVLAEKTNS
ncbi:MAG: hypothetical protein KKE62_03710 [Proteobacteria bacterium]|nr:hypothetical protein [Pseudomonadota bacterium]MBU1387483.1 hypothetical protein [Pseudomonadota bacterium]MBU1541930.1 hypothetical protein [Pseudomonadota bacterium]